MAGRKRKAGPRYPNGDLKPQGEPIVPAVWARIRSEAAKLADDRRLSSEIGRLSFHREITDLQAATAFRVGAIYHDFARAKQLARTARSPNYERGFGRGGDDDVIIKVEDMDLLLDGDPLKKRMRAAIAAQEAFADLQEHMNILTVPQRHMIERLCVDDGHLTADELVTVRQILDWLATKIGKSVSKGKARRAERNTRLLKPRPTTGLDARAQRREPPPDHVVLKALLTKLRPDLAGHELAKVCALADGLKDREIERRRQAKKKAATPGKRVAASQAERPQTPEGSSVCGPPAS